MRRRRHGAASFVEPDLPITPMLDMSFQLLAFFVATFNPTPLEGHLDMALPVAEGGGEMMEKSMDNNEKEHDKLTVTVMSNDAGGIGTITVTEIPAKDNKTKIHKTREVNADYKSKHPIATALKMDLSDYRKEHGPAKVKLEMAANLKYQYVVQLMDVIKGAGLKEVTPSIIR